jgi:hypothetical protein
VGNFEQTPEYQQSLRMRPACDRVLDWVFGCGDNIHRFDKEGGHVLDKQFHIDLTVKLRSGATLTGQEKALSHRYYKYRTFTMEYHQNHATKEGGEFFKIASQFYLSGYSDETGIEFIEWKVLDVLRLQRWLASDRMANIPEPRRAGGSRATFIPIKYDDIPAECIFSQGVAQ